MDEIWTDINGFEGLYKVSNSGKIFSCPRKYVKHNGKILTPNNGARGYLQVDLCKEGKQHRKYVHHLVAEHFLGHLELSRHTVVDHINNDRSNNNLSNLQIITSRLNASKDKKGVSKYTGVCWNKNLGKWQSSIRNGKNKIHLGYFDNEIEAYNTYQQKLKEII